VIEDPQAAVIREEVTITEEEIGVQVLKLIHNAAENAKIEYADVLVAGGRGVGGPDGFRLLQQLADELGGVVAAPVPVWMRAGLPMITRSAKPAKRFGRKSILRPVFRGNSA
jgi:electron transfer flavoprotein alpha subunit